MYLYAGSGGIRDSIRCTDMVHRQRWPCVRRCVSTCSDPRCRYHGLHCFRRRVLLGRVRVFISLWVPPAFIFLLNNILQPFDQPPTTGSYNILVFLIENHIIFLLIITVGCAVQDHWCGADRSGTVPGAVGQERRKEVCCTGKGCDSVHTGAQQHQDTHHSHQDLPHSATASFLHRKCLTPLLS